MVQDRRIIPVFVNVDGILRPGSAKRIWDELARPDRKLEVMGIKHFVDGEYEKIAAAAKETVYGQFLEMKAKYEERTEQNYKKYLYALDLRLEAAERIGIETIMRGRLETLQQEKARIEAQYACKSRLCPVFRPVFIAFME